MLLARIALGAASALWAMLVYGEAERLAAEPVALPGWFEAALDPDGLAVGPVADPAR